MSTAGNTLAQAWIAGRQIEVLPSEARPTSLAAAYDQQDAFVAHLNAAKGAASGFKLGLGSPNGMKAAGLARAVVGSMFADRAFASGDAVTVASRAAVMLEIEIAVRLSCHVRPDSTSDPRACVAAAYLASELVQTRLAHRKAAGVLSFIADNVGFEAMVLGPQIAIGDIARALDDVTVDVDGERRVGAQLDGDKVDPWQTLGHLFDHARERNITLPAGCVVITGAIAVPFDITGPSARITGRAAGASVDFTIRWPS